MAYIPISLKNEIDRQDRRYCCYCQTSEANSGIPLTYDHILPQLYWGKEHIFKCLPRLLYLQPI
ncbi:MULTISPECIES: hypothetical protein [Moorena]|uniref:HNH endonuclease n=1 Tax=Moorena producens 3L TaxID=489825 RepID=F4Y0J0_9CYAN|nr:MULTISPECIES: hypothetical protein [Moorena]EGJ29614.1 hypothetical protein LYNGBM3L_61870 [Moorena producens 3L]